MTFEELWRIDRRPAFNAEGAGGGDAATTETTDTAATPPAESGDEGAPAVGVLSAGKPGAGETPESTKTEGAEGGETSEKGELDPGDIVPENGEYTFELPDGREVDPEWAEAAKPVLAELGLTQSQANRLAAFTSDMLTKQTEASAEAWKTLTDDDVKAAKADPDLTEGGWDTMVQLGNRALEQFADEDFKAQNARGFIRTTSPAFLRFMRKVGEALADDRTEFGSAGAAGDVPIEDRWYGATTPRSKRA